MEEYRAHTKYVALPESHLGLLSLCWERPMNATTRKELGKRCAGPAQVHLHQGLALISNMGWLPKFASNAMVPQLDWGRIHISWSIFSAVLSLENSIFHLSKDEIKYLIRSLLLYLLLSICLLSRGVAPGLANKEGKTLFHSQYVISILYC